jgi:carbonic anhydrase
MKLFTVLVFLISSIAIAQDVNADEALQRLIEGNQRFTTGNLIHPYQSSDVREQLTKGQHPFAIILSCSDSRVPPEIIFDQGLGNLFIIRVAGNVIDEVTAASIEYAAEHLHSPLLIVLGHEYCGAVSAAFGDEDLGHNISHLLKLIKPSVEAAKQSLNENKIEEAIIGNVGNSISMLLNNSEIINHLVKENKLKIMGGIYNLGTGKVDLLE